MKNLDNLLKDWDDANKPDLRDVDSVKKEVLDQVSNRGQAVERRSTHITIHKAWFAGGIATAAAAAIFACLLFMQPRTVTVATSSDKVAALTIGDLEDLTKVAGEVNHLFPEGVRWIVKDGDRLEIKTGKTLNPETNDPGQIAIRYVVLEKAGDSWQQIHLTDIVAKTGEPIELDGDTRGHVWTFKAEEGIYALDSQLSFQLNGTEVNVNFSSGVESRKTQEMKSITHNGREYKIYQAIMAI